MSARVRAVQSHGRVPSAAEYVRALSSLEPLPQSYRGMLQFHSDRPKVTCTAAQAAAAVGFKNYRGAALHYGRLARLVGGKLVWKPRGEVVHLAVRVEFVQRARRWHWIMRPELVAAIRKLRWPKRNFELMP